MALPISSRKPRKLGADIPRTSVSITFSIFSPGMTIVRNVRGMSAKNYNKNNMLKSHVRGVTSFVPEGQRADRQHTP